MLSHETTAPIISDQLKELLQSASVKIPIKKGTFLFQEGEKAADIFLLESGRVQISKMNADGRELTLRICSKDDLVGELTLFSDEATYLLNAKVLEAGEASVIKKSQLEQKLMENGKLAFEFMKWMSDHFRKTQTKFRDLVLNGKKGALYSTLIRLTNTYGVKTENGILIDIPLTNQELANFCATSREGTNRMLSDLRKQGVISIDKLKITIHDLEYLKDEINCERCPIVYCTID
ncbi:Crp/Fnr family transcriptional regulator [Bacillus sp. HMF5848]|uniref:Crp/Fnr family transcriptional regulator n=1 Tax=Bacillus sp. HMF5848 TaxID=2495421 RepID=UPI000F7B4D5D|nr:Crp/Fnr family transcriptional regulator [Bacillus sp. HMF5848]RSK27931.1 Crp/Fnr family transcriptional regulator [Bacillus sp. HMF5848]